MLTFIGALLIVSGTLCIVFDMGMKAAKEEKPEQEKDKDAENKPG